MLLKHTSTSDELPIINLTPMLDVVFNLIVFFMVGTKFVEMDHHLKLDLPRVSDAGPMVAAPSKKQVSVYRDGKIHLDGREVTLDQLTAQLRQACAEYPGLAVVVRGDGKGELQPVVDALAAVSKSGVAETSICVRLGDGDKTRR
jgi:biopolymer transport protein ExbD